MEWHFTESQARSALEICRSKGDTAMNDAMATLSRTKLVSRSLKLS